MSWDPPPGPPGWGTPGQPPFGPPPQGPFGPPPPHVMGPPPQYMPPDRGVVILVLAIASIFVMFFGCAMCGPFALAGLGLSIPALIMGKKDLREIQEGRMNPAGRDLTMVGYVIAIISTVLSALVGLVMLVIMVLYGSLFVAALATQPSGPY